MKANEEHTIHLGKNIKHLMRAFQITQAQLAEKLGMPDSHICNLLQKSDIDDNTLQRIADAIGYDVTVDMLKNYNHDDTIRYISNTYNNTIESGATNNGTFQEVFEKGSSQNKYVAEQAFELAEKNTKLEKLLLYYRMQIEPDAVKIEMESLKKDNKAE